MNTTKKSRNRQKGLSSVGWLVVASIFGLLVISILRIFPIYMENYTIKSVLTSVQEDAKIDPKSKRAIWDAITNRLYINEIRSIKREHVKMTRKDGKTTVTLNYENRQPYLGNLFIVGKFSESIVIDR